MQEISLQLSISPFIYVISNNFCNTMMLYCHETHFIFHQSLWKWWSEIIYPVLVNGLGFFFILTTTKWENSLANSYPLLQQMYCCDTSQIMFNICANKEKYSVTGQSLKWEKLVYFPSVLQKAHVLIQSMLDLHLYVKTVNFKNAWVHVTLGLV